MHFQMVSEQFLSWRSVIDLHQKVSIEPPIACLGGSLDVNTLEGIAELKVPSNHPCLFDSIPPVALIAWL